MRTIDDQIRAIRPHVSLSLQQIESVYRPVLERHQHSGADGDGVTAAIRAIRLRRGYIIPYGAPPEDTVHDSEKWTFAVFLCALRAHEGFATSPAAALRWLRERVPASALDWVGPTVGRVLVQGLTGEALSDNPMSVIIARSAVGAGGDAVVCPAPDQADPVGPFLGWILQEIQADRLRINLVSSPVHIVPEGLLIRPDALALYLRDTGVSLDQRQLIGSPLFIAPSTYGASRKGHVVMVEGLVIRPALTGFERLRVNPALRRLSPP